MTHGVWIVRKVPGAVSLNARRTAKARSIRLLRRIALVAKARPTVSKGGSQSPTKPVQPIHFARASTTTVEWVVVLS